MSKSSATALYNPHGNFNPRHRQRNQRRLTLENLSAKVGPQPSTRPQHLSEIESGKRDPRLSSIERMAEAKMLMIG
jgi:hypothetical protein